MPLPKLSDKRSGAIAIQIYTADIKDLIFALNIFLIQMSLLDSHLLLVPKVSI